MSRDFTYVDYIVDGMEAVINKDLPDGKKYGIYNIGNSSPVNLLRFIEKIEESLGKTAQKQMMPMQLGDVNQTWADVSSLDKDFGYQPSTEIKEGISRFVAWYKNYYKVGS